MMRCLLIFLVFLSSCSVQDESVQKWAQAEGKVKVLSTISMIDDLVRQVGGEHVSTLTLVRGELDPHSYQLVKGDDEKLAASDLIFFNGLGLEHGPSLREYLASSSKAVGLGDKIKDTNPKQIFYLERTPDPHIWMDISMWALTVPFIVEALSAKDPSHSDEYKVNGEVLVKRMLEEHEQLKKMIHTLPEEKRFLITSHDAFNYFTRGYLATDQEREEGKWQKRFAAPEGLAPESQLSAMDIRLILDHMKLYHIHVIFPESNVSQSSIRKLLDAGNEEGLKLTIANETLYGDAMGKKGTSGDTYLKMIRHNVETLVETLKHNGFQE